ncbi:unnamed protein product, partial [Musa acuminata var. zebrina]
LVLKGEGDGGGNGRGKEERRKKKKRRKMRKRRDYKGRASEDEVGKEGCARIGSLNLNANRYNSVVLTSLFREPIELLVMWMLLFGIGFSKPLQFF